MLPRKGLYSGLGFWRGIPWLPRRTGFDGLGGHVQHRGEIRDGDMYEGTLVG